MDAPQAREEEPTIEDVHDPEAAADDLLAAVTVDEDEPARTRPPWVAPLSERMRPGPEASSRREAGDLLPDEAPPRRTRWAFWRR